MPARIDIKMLVREVSEIHDHYPSWTLDNAFIHWFLSAFLVPDLDAAAKCVTGVSHDKGCDGILIDDALEKVFVLQGKFHKGAKPPTEARSDVLAFAQVSRKLTGSKKEFDQYRKSIDPTVGQLLSNARNRIHKRHYKLDLYYVTTGRCSSPLKSEVESEVAQANGVATISVLDRDDVLSLLMDYLGGAAPPVPFLDLKIDPRGIVGSDGVVQRYDVPTGIESWILSMSGRDLAALYERAGDRLFARNIRGFLGDTAINDGMAQTLSGEPANFWYFNNGVTLVCDSARKTAERGQAVLRVTNPQVINGQQTTRVLFNTRTEKARNSAVLVRVISVPRSADNGQERFERLVSNIVAATNWQNAILPSDLRANDTRQVSLQRDLAKIGYHYIRKRQTKREAKRLLGNQHWFSIKKEELAQVVGACEFDPVVVRSGKEGLFKQPYYDQIFDNRNLRDYLSMYWLGRIVKQVGSGYPDRAYAKWHALHLLWGNVAHSLRSKAAAAQFRDWCERRETPKALHSAADQIYRALLEFFRINRGEGPHATDISNFFYRPRQHEGFAAHWLRPDNRRRTRVRKLIHRFETDLANATNG